MTDKRAGLEQLLPALRGRSKTVGRLARQLENRPDVVSAVDRFIRKQLRGEIDSQRILGAGSGGVAVPIDLPWGRKGVAKLSPLVDPASVPGGKLPAFMAQPIEPSKYRGIDKYVLKPLKPAQRYDLGDGRMLHVHAMPMVDTKKIEQMSDAELARHGRRIALGLRRHGIFAADIKRENFGYDPRWFVPPWQRVKLIDLGQTFETPRGLKRLDDDDFVAMGMRDPLRHQLPAAPHLWPNPWYHQARWRPVGSKQASLGTELSLRGRHLLGLGRNHPVVSRLDRELARVLGVEAGHQIGAGSQGVVHQLKGRRPPWGFDPRKHVLKVQNIQPDQPALLLGLKPKDHWWGKVPHQPNLLDDRAVAVPIKRIALETPSMYGFFGREGTLVADVMPKADPTRFARLSPEKKIRVGERLARRLVDRGLYHEDLKPDNILAFGKHYRISDLGGLRPMTAQERALPKDEMVRRLLDRQDFIGRATIGRDTDPLDLALRDKRIQLGVMSAAGLGAAGLTGAAILSGSEGARHHVGRAISEFPAADRALGVQLERLKGEEPMKAASAEQVVALAKAAMTEAEAAKILAHPYMVHPIAQGLSEFLPFVGPPTRWIARASAASQHAEAKRIIEAATKRNLALAAVGGTALGAGGMAAADAYGAGKQAALAEQYQLGFQFAQQIKAAGLAPLID